MTSMRRFRVVDDCKLRWFCGDDRSFTTRRGGPVRVLNLKANRRNDRTARCVERQLNANQINCPSEVVTSPWHHSLLNPETGKPQSQRRIYKQTARGANDKEQDLACFLSKTERKEIQSSPPTSQMEMEMSSRSMGSSLWGSELEPLKERSESYSTDDDSYYDEVGFLFEANQPVRLEQFEWNPSVAVCLHVADDEPGNIQSGQYLWPASHILADYVVRNQESVAVESVVELGAGCGLCGLAALQVWKQSLRYIVMTDRDRNVLARARDNLETTVQRLIENSNTDEELNTLINSVASIPVDFEMLEWGDASTGAKIIRELSDHTETGKAHLLLGSDLIYCHQVVEPLLRSVVQLMDERRGRFWLAQSIRYDVETENTINKFCAMAGLEQRTLFLQGVNRIQEFYFRH